MARRFKEHIEQVFLRQWFPPDDPIATVVARLAILREDYILELYGMIKKGKEPFDETSENRGLNELDDNSPEWRRLYFFRNSLRTLREIAKAMNSLYGNPDSRKRLSTRSKALQESLKILNDKLTATAALVKGLRDTIGGHVLREGVQAALNNMDTNRRGFLQVGRTPDKIHYKFTSDLILSIMLPGVKEEEQATKIEDILTKTATLISVIRAIDTVMGDYIEDCGLHR